MISIRRLTADAAAVLSKMGGKSLLESHGHSAPAEIMQAYVDKNFSVDACTNELKDEANIFYAVYYKDEPAGYYKIILNKQHTAVPAQPVTYMERLYLLKAFYNLKLGQQLMQHAIEYSKAAGEKGMWLTVWQKNERAMHFYEKSGFIKMAESKFYLNKERFNPTWVMWLSY